MAAKGKADDFGSRSYQIMELLRGRDLEQKEALAVEIMLEFERIYRECEKIEDPAEREELKFKIKESMASIRVRDNYATRH